MIEVVFRNGLRRYFDQIDRRRIQDGILIFAGLGGCEVIIPTADVAEIYLNRRSRHAEAAE